MQKLTNKGDSPLAFSHQPSKGEAAFEAFELAPGWGKDLTEAQVEVLKADDSFQEQLTLGTVTLEDIGPDKVAKAKAETGAEDTGKTLETQDDGKTAETAKAPETPKAAAPAKAPAAKAPETPASPEKEAADAELKAALEGK